MKSAHTSLFNSPESLPSPVQKKIGKKTVVLDGIFNSPTKQELYTQQLEITAILRYTAVNDVFNNPSDEEMDFEVNTQKTNMPESPVSPAIIPAKLSRTAPAKTPVPPILAETLVDYNTGHEEYQTNGTATWGCTCFLPFFERSNNFVYLFAFIVQIVYVLLNQYTVC